MTTPDATPPLPPDMPADVSLVTGAAPPNQDGEWMTVSEAVARTGRAERTIRRWIDDGSIEHKRQAGRLLVWVPTTGTAPDIAVTQQLALVERQAELLERLTERQAELAERQAAPLIEIIRQLERENGRLKAENRAITLEVLEARKLAARPAWWRRWLP